ncbi:MAG: HAD family hydrolase [Pelagimonas sp.]|uniref:HAD family hydrolase n=1 Tax=Roseobacteraceae TaxID=2854170 RepID=UPI0037451BAB
MPSRYTGIHEVGSGLPSVFDGIEAVCFDAFGTLVEITDKQQAFRPLFKALTPDKRRELKHRLMREDRAFTDWPEALGAEIDPRELLEVMERMMVETGSIALRPGMAEIWARLRSERLRLALCSNLASDYVTALRSALPDAPDVEALSCKIGAIKPEPAIYAKVLDGLQVEVGRVLFVGDTRRADIVGPRAAGMKAIHVDELVRVMFPS